MMLDEDASAMQECGASQNGSSLGQKVMGQMMALSPVSTAARKAERVDQMVM
jgi:hypothetical protein